MGAPWLTRTSSKCFMGAFKYSLLNLVGISRAGSSPDCLHSQSGSLMSSYENPRVMDLSWKRSFTYFGFGDGTYLQNCLASGLALTRLIWESEHPHNTVPWKLGCTARPPDQPHCSPSRTLLARDGDTGLHYAGSESLLGHFCNLCAS